MFARKLVTFQMISIIRVDETDIVMYPYIFIVRLYPSTLKMEAAGSLKYIYILWYMALFVSG